MRAKLSQLWGLVPCVMLGTVVVAAYQGAAPPKPIVPAATSSILSDPRQFDGVLVTVYASVERIVSATSFTVDQDPTKATADVLVVAPVLNQPVTANKYVTVIGEVTMVEGRPAIRATSVLDGRMVDLAKRLLPPMTPEETAFDATMKKVQPAFGALRTAVTGANAEGVKTNAAILKQAFADTEAFWKLRGKADAQKWAADARAQADLLEKSSGAGDEVKAAVTALQQTCSSCHGVYRERQDDGTYRIRGEVK